jgi:hypothetical protein
LLSKYIYIGNDLLVKVCARVARFSANAFFSRADL